MGHTLAAGHCLDARRRERNSVPRVDADFALKFTDEWVAGWNSHDLDRILTHYADDVVFSSPHVIERFGKPSGEVHGKEELRAYWGSGLQGERDLHFTVEDVRFSVDTIVINYRNQRGGAVAEVLRFRDGLVCWGCGAYAPGR
jgi:ketosteroid isomerase-like protein